MLTGRRKGQAQCNGSGHGWQGQATNARKVQEHLNGCVWHHTKKTNGCMQMWRTCMHVAVSYLHFGQAPSIIAALARSDKQLWLDAKTAAEYARKCDMTQKTDMIAATSGIGKVFSSADLLFQICSTKIQSTCSSCNPKTMTATCVIQNGEGQGDGNYLGNKNGKLKKNMRQASWQTATVWATKTANLRKTFGKHLGRWQLCGQQKRQI